MGAELRLYGTLSTRMCIGMYISQAFRQKDPRYLNILHEIREGRVSDEHRAILEGQV